MKQALFLNDIKITDISNEGTGIGRYENRVVFVDKAVPGDVADVKIYKSKKKFYEASIVKIKEASSLRSEPFCQHFGTCGGCRWQHLKYEAQLQFKEKQVKDAFERIGNQTGFETEPILASPLQTTYRNRLDFGFSNKKYLSIEEIRSGRTFEDGAVGFHLPRLFDKVVDIQTCYLMDDLNNQIRLAVKSFAIENKLSFYDHRQHEGLLRGMVIRNTNRGEWMVIMMFGKEDNKGIEMVMHFIRTHFPQLHSLMYVINTKRNDTIYDLPVQLYQGERFITASIDDLKFRISPKSFFQTNSGQVARLYKVAFDFAEIKPHEHVYDLYCGTGTISCMAARHAKQVTGIEYVEDAVKDARLNAELNGLNNLSFHAGDLKDLLTLDFFLTHGKPQVMMIDPPRSGMHAEVTEAVNQSEAERLVYVSCNPATQARDISLLSNYKLIKVRPVDMFPHTLHVENVALLIRKT
ncbi:MAG: 23S rRNA (uracil(1939)-C(5))-methyltransferase RlmD [Bacteroidia bacterium]|nr:23S rRNA (uracil(1939)-C(5))-methyltransferase RlmD [Bacteroidia bacterium]